MRTVKKQIPNLLGLMTQYDPTQVPLGGAMSTQGMAMLEEGRIRRIPGVTAINNAPVDMSTWVPLLFWAENLGSSSDYSVAVAVGAAARYVVNLTSDVEITGPALTGAFLTPWTHTFYAQKHIIGGGDNHPQELATTTTRIDLTGTDVPHGNLVQSFLDRLYISDISTEEGIVRYSDVLTTTFGASSVVNTKEVPGKVTCLAVLSIGTDVAGIDTYLVICKRNAIWLWNETSKDIISQSVGTESPHTWVNTQVGPIFMGKDGNRNSIFYIPNGSTGEPKDIGRALHGLMNTTTSSVSNAVLACAVEHEGFYKLTFAHTGSTTANSMEVWLDLNRMAKGGEVVWYGPHYRGNSDAMLRTETRLELIKRSAVSVNNWFTENADTTAGFLSMAGTTMPAVLDIPLNAEPLDEEKVFDVMELQIARETNTSGNEISVSTSADEIILDSYASSLYDNTTSGILRPILPLYASGTLGQAAKSSRIAIQHSLNKRFDILGATIQYLYNEDSHVKSKI